MNLSIRYEHFQMRFFSFLAMGAGTMRKKSSGGDTKKGRTSSCSSSRPSKPLKTLKQLK